MQSGATNITVASLSNRKAAPTSGRGVEGLASPLVGREHELSTLEAARAELASRHGQIVTLMGEAGLGKSRLVEEARGAPSPQNSESVNLRWLEGRALSYGQTLSYWPLIQLVKNDLDLSDADPEAKIKVALRRRVQALFGDRANDVLPMLEHWLGLKLDPVTTERMNALDDATLKQRVFQSIAEYLSVFYSFKCC